MFVIFLAGVHVEAKTEKCVECGKEISDDEWVTCWMSCEQCLNKSLEAYEEMRRKRGEA